MALFVGSNITLDQKSAIEGTAFDTEIKSQKTKIVFAVQISIFRELQFELLKTNLINIMTVEAGMDKNTFVTDYVKAEKSSAQLAVKAIKSVKTDDLLKLFATGSKSFRRIRALCTVFNQIGEFEGAIMEIVEKQYDVVKAAYFSDEEFDAARLQSQLIERVLPDIRVTLQKNSNWQGMLGVLIGKYGTYLPPSIRQLFNSGAPPTTGILAGK